MSNPVPVTRPLFDAVRGPWRSFLEEIEPLRTDLYRYCRYLTRSPWDAEDLVQDTMARAFVTLGCLTEEVENVRAWLFRVASNLWLNKVRRPSDRGELQAVATDTSEPRATREAAGTLLVTLSPQERAAVVLKDVFDFSIEEIAEALSTTVGAIKTALHRGRGKLAEPATNEDARPAPAVLDAFVAAFNARDLDRLTGLLLDTAAVEFPSLHVEYGSERARKGSLAGILFGNPAGDRGGVAPSLRRGLLPQAPRLEHRSHRGETILLAWFAHEDGEAVRAISRVEVEGDRISRLRTYLHQPEVLAEVCAELALPFRSSGYRHWW